MKKMSRKERERMQRREYILDMAEAVISERGFDGVTMDEIAEKAEVGKGTLYLYFKNKTSICVAVGERGAKMLHDQMARVLELDIPGVEMIEKFGYIYIDFIEKNPLYFEIFNYTERILLEDESIVDEEIRLKCEEDRERAMAYIVRSLQIGMQDGSIDSRYNPKELALVIMGAFKGITNMVCLKYKGGLFKILDEVEFDIESMVKSFMQLMVSGIGKK